MNYRFKDIREDNDLKQYQMANKLKMSRSTYAGIELEIDPIKLSTYNLFCNEFHYSMDYTANLTTTAFYKDIVPIKTLDKKVIRKRLCTIEKELHKTAKDIADELGISPTTYSDYKNIKKKNLIQTLMIRYIAVTYNYSMDWMVGRSEQKYVKK